MAGRGVGLATNERDQVKPLRNSLALVLIALALAACAGNVGVGSSQSVGSVWKQADAKGGGD